jgi:hypothetical protein
MATVMCGVCRDEMEGETVKSLRHEYCLRISTARVSAADPTVDVQERR